MSEQSNAPRACGPSEIDVYELCERMQAGVPPVVVDVREPHELQIASISGLATIEIPMSQFEARWAAELGQYRDSELVLLCRSGSRTARVQGFLRHCGFTGTRNLVGGILAWSSAIDTSVPKY